MNSLTPRQTADARRRHQASGLIPHCLHERKERAAIRERVAAPCPDFCCESDEYRPIEHGQRVIAIEFVSGAINNFGECLVLSGSRPAVDQLLSPNDHG
jgi:hypothetical protein